MNSLKMYLEAKDLCGVRGNFLILYLMKPFRLHNVSNHKFFFLLK